MVWLASPLSCLLVDDGMDGNLTLPNSRVLTHFQLYLNGGIDRQWGVKLKIGLMLS